MKVRRALISVSDYEGLIEFAQGLCELGVELFATTGTGDFLRDKGVSALPVEQLTGSPNYVGGRVKTLHPAIHGAIMARRHVKEDMDDLAALQTEPIDMVICNLYPFAKKKLAGADEEELRELIDVGGSTLLRAAAKNWPYVASVCEPDFYRPILDELQENDCELSPETLQELCHRSFEVTANYDREISRTMAMMWSADGRELSFPERIVIDGRCSTQMKYGENPHQKAALYVVGEEAGVAGARRVKGDALSYNNLLDCDSAWRAVCAFEKPAAVVVKHMTPCGLALGCTIDEALVKALAGDLKSAFGGTIALNRHFTNECANKLKKAKIFIELIIAPSFSDEALATLRHKKKLRCLACSQLVAPPMELRSITGGLLVQESDRYTKPSHYETVGRHKLPEGLRETLAFAWQAVGAVKSNAIVIARGLELVGVGSGQTSRVDAVINALQKAKTRANGAVLASDAFFPFPDSIEFAAEAGIVAIIQPGGSKRDREVIEACDKAGISMVLTGRRRFRH